MIIMVSCRVGLAGNCCSQEALQGSNLAAVGIVGRKLHRELCIRKSLRNALPRRRCIAAMRCTTSCCK